MRFQTRQRFSRNRRRGWRYCKFRIVSILSRNCNGSLALLFLSADPLANFVQDALYFIDHGSSAGGFLQLNLRTRLDAMLQPTRGRTGIEIGDAFNQMLTGHAKKPNAVEPVVGFAVMTMHSARDRIIVNSQPAIKRTHGFKHFPATHGAKLDLLLFRVRAIGTDAVTIAYEKTDYRLIDNPVAANHQAHQQRLSGLNDLDAMTCSICQFGCDNLGAAVSMSISVAERRQAFVPPVYRFTRRRGAFIICLLARHDDFLITIEHVSRLTVFYDSPRIQQKRARAKRSHRR